LKNENNWLRRIGNDNFFHRFSWSALSMSKEYSFIFKTISSKNIEKPQAKKAPKGAFLC
jgi:hypothetical protein